MTGTGCFSWRNKETARESKNWSEKNRKQHPLWAVLGETETSAPNSGVLRPLMSVWYKNYSLSTQNGASPCKNFSTQDRTPPGDACLTPDSLTRIIHAGRLCPSSIGLTPGCGLMSTILATFQIIHIYRYSYKKLIIDIHTSDIDIRYVDT